MVQTCQSSFGYDGEGGTVPEWPAGPVLSLAISFIFIAIRARLAYLMSLSADPSKVTAPFYGVPMGGFWRQIAGLFVCLNLPSFLLFKVFRDLPYLEYNSLEFACRNQNGNQLSPGDYISILNVAFLLAVLLNSNRRLVTRWVMADRLAEGVIAPLPGYGTSRIAFLQAASGTWVLPFLKRFYEAASAAASAPSNGDVDVDVDCVCLDNFGLPKGEYRDDSWLRLNLALDEGGWAPSHSTLKVVVTDFLSLDLPEGSIDVFVVPTGAHLPAVAMHKGSDADKQALLDGLLREMCRCLRPGGRVVSSMMKAIGSQAEQWETACTAAGLRFERYSEPEIPQWVGWLPWHLRLLFLPDARGVGTGRRGWLPGAVYWSVFPAYMHVATKPAGAAEVSPRDVIPLGGGEAAASSKRLNPAAASALSSPSVASSSPSSPSSPSSSSSSPTAPAAASPESPATSLQMLPVTTIPTAPPIVFDPLRRSLVEREENDVFPPGSQFRLVEALVALRVALWLLSIAVVWLYLPLFQVFDYLPASRQLVGFFMTLIGVHPILIFFNSAELREAAKTQGVATPPRVLRAKVWRTYGAQRVNALLLVIFIACTWLPYFLLDFYLIKYRGETVESVQQTNTYIGLAIGVSLALGVPRVTRYYARLMKDNAARAAREEKADLEREERESASLGNAKSSREAVVLNPVRGEDV